MSIADYNSFGLLENTITGAYAVLSSGSLVITPSQSGEYSRIHTNVGDKFTIVHAHASPGANVYPFIITTESGEVTFYGQGDNATNYELDITTDKIGGQSGYIYFNNIRFDNDSRPLLVYQHSGSQGLLHQAVQNELIMLIQKQLKEMSE